MVDNENNTLSQKEKNKLDRQMERLEPKLETAKQKYDTILSRYKELFDKRHPEKKAERIKETLYQAYRESRHSLDQILAYMAGEDDEC